MGEPFKNMLGAGPAREIARAVRKAHAAFDLRKFENGLERELRPLELKGRMHAIKNRLIAGLPEDPRRSFPILVDSVEHLEGFLLWPHTHVVADRGLGHFDLSMKALHRMTQAFTAEFAVRPFFLHHEDRTLRQFERWVTDPSEHVRRLVSEGSRPLLPWGERLPSFVRDPDKTYPLLDALKADPAEYVRRSVANHLNDHAKNHGDWVIDRLSRWKKASPESPELQWVISRATRTLVKQGHPGALALHGIGSARIDVLEQKLLTPSLRVGQKLGARLVLRNREKEEAKIIVDHEIRFLKADGKHSPKVFKGKTLRLGPGGTVALELELPIRKVTTRVYYTGTQYWSPLVNGVAGKSLAFDLRA